MPIEGNVLGLMIFVVGGVVAGIGALLLKLPDAMTMIAVGLTLSIVDLAFRFRSRSAQNWLMSKKLGGSLFFIPAWGFGIIVIVVNIINSLQ